MGIFKGLSQKLLCVIFISVTQSFTEKILRTTKKDYNHLLTFGAASWIV